MQKIYKYINSARPHVTGMLALFITAILLFTSSCQKYLDAKPDKSLAVPSTIQDYQALMDFSFMNTAMPYAASVGSDDYFVRFSDWQTFGFDGRNDYVWDAHAIADRDWNYGYTNIVRCNVILDGIDQLTSTDQATKNNVKGQALFFRSYYFYQLANEYTLPYNASNAGTNLGIALRLKADVTAKTTRSTLEQTYQQIVGDLKTAGSLLPVYSPYKSRATRPAAFGALARTYLVMQDYKHANLYADSCLQLYSKLIDYNTLDTSSLNPFVKFNDEVILHAIDNGQEDVVDPYYARVDTFLYKSYADNDLRKYLFYTYAEDGHYAFKGDYHGESYGNCFAGIVTDETLLIRSETYARLGQVDKAINDLNTLLVTRYVKGTFTPYSQSISAGDALALILTERRKELAFRSGTRWSDLKRLNQDPKFTKTLTRNLDGTVYTLPPNDNRYAFLLPVSVIQMTGVPQNPR